MSHKTVLLDPSMLEALIVGGCFFGSGGGGTLTSAKNLLKHFRDGDFYPTTQVRVVPAEAAIDGDSVVVAYMGAPALINDAKYPTGPAKAVELVLQRLARQNRELKYIVPPESGALGFLVACLVAAKHGLSVVDGDGAGRAVPSLPMLTFAAECVPPNPAFVVSQDGLAVELDVEAPEGSGSHRHQQDVATIVEHMLRPIVSEPEFGQFGGLATWIMSPTLLQKALKVKGTLSRALGLGQAILDGELATSDGLLEYLRGECGVRAFLLCRGTLQAGSLTSTGGFDLGRIEIQHGVGRTMSLYQNESLIAWDSSLGHPLAMAPDSIAYFLEDNVQRVASNGDLVATDGSLLPESRGARVALIGMAADPALRQLSGAEEEGLIMRSFMTQLGVMGYHGAYVPVEKLNVGSTKVMK
jgi:uncharacterized protein